MSLWPSKEAAASQVPDSGQPLSERRAQPGGTEKGECDKDNGEGSQLPLEQRGVSHVLGKLSQKRKRLHGFLQVELTCSRQRELHADSMTAWQCGDKGPGHTGVTG